MTTMTGAEDAPIMTGSTIAPQTTDLIMTTAGVAAAGGIVLETSIAGRVTDTIAIDLAPDHRVNHYAIDRIARIHHHRHVQARW